MSKIEDLKNKIKSKPQSPHEQLIEPILNPQDGSVNLNARKKRKKFEETHTRQTYYIENEVLKKLNEMAEGEKGEKTRIINEALKQYLKI